MDLSASVTVDASRFPGWARAAYVNSFADGRMDHQFHYDTEKQAQLWLAVHEAYSPARNDLACLDTYHRALSDSAQKLPNKPCAVISLGCGGGQKDLALIKSLHPKGMPITYVPADVSLPLVLVSHLRVRGEFPSLASHPLVLNISEAGDLNQTLAPLVPSDATRLFAFFGMLPNFEPDQALRPIAAAMRPDDLLLVSANLAPGNDYRAGVEKVLPLYDNPPTRRWLAAVLIDAGLEIDPRDLDFSVASSSGLLRIEASCPFSRPQTIRIDEVEFQFRPGDSFRLFYSYRHTPGIFQNQARAFGFNVIDQWITPAGDEGLFLCERECDG